jgi:hypothetical protein
MHARTAASSASETEMLRDTENLLDALEHARKTAVVDRLAYRGARPADAVRELRDRHSPFEQCAPQRKRIVFLGLIFLRHSREVRFTAVNQLRTQLHVNDKM